MLIVTSMNGPLTRSTGRGIVSELSLRKLIRRSIIHSPARAAAHSQFRLRAGEHHHHQQAFAPQRPGALYSLFHPFRPTHGEAAPSYSCRSCAPAVVGRAHIYLHLSAAHRSTHSLSSNEAISYHMLRVGVASMSVSRPHDGRVDRSDGPCDDTDRQTEQNTRWQY